MRRNQTHHFSHGSARTDSMQAAVCVGRIVMDEAVAQNFVEARTKKSQPAKARRLRTF